MVYWDSPFGGCSLYLSVVVNGCCFVSFWFDVVFIVVCSVSLCLCFVFCLSGSRFVC